MTLNRNQVVDSFLESLDHPMSPVIERLRLAGEDFDFDPSKWNGLLEMIGQDRGQVIFPNAEAAAAQQDEFVALVREWVRA